MQQQPNSSLYIKNLDWKVKKPVLRRALRSLFTRHGKVLEVIVLRRDGLRGQAWVLLNSVEAATEALQAQQGFNLFGKDLMIEYARTPSKRVVQRQSGTFVRTTKRTVLDGAIQKTGSIKREYEMDKEEAPSAATDKIKNEEATVAAPQKDSNVDEQPTKYLLAENLPAECNEMMLGMLFRQYAGFKEVRFPRPGLAFVEFEHENHADAAKNGLDGFQLTGSEVLTLKFGKA